MKMPRVISVGLSLLLLVAVGLVIYGEASVPAPRFTAKLHDLLPPAPQGWTMKEKAIADSPEMKAAVGELLNFDDGVFVDYTASTGQRLSVYMAYWTPGKMSHRLVAGHTPDVCWVNNGWVKQTASTVPLAARFQGNIPPCENRVYTSNGTPEYVWFWHLVGDEAKSYATGANPPWYAPLSDLWARGLKQRDEQFFIRISSDQPLETLNDGPMLRALLERLPWP